MSKKSVPKLLAIALALVIVLSTAVSAYDEGDQLLIPDLLVGKPLGFITLGLGTLTWAVTLPVTIPFGWEKNARGTLVTKPYKWTFERGLGEDLEKF